MKPPTAWWEVKLEPKDDIKGKEYPVKKRKPGRPRKERFDTLSLSLPSGSQETVSIMVESSRVKAVEKDESLMLSGSEFTFPVENEKSESDHELGEAKLEKPGVNSLKTKYTNDSKSLILKCCILI